MDLLIVILLILGVLFLFGPGGLAAIFYVLGFIGAVLLMIALFGRDIIIVPVFMVLGLMLYVVWYYLKKWGRELEEWSKAQKERESQR